MTVAALDHLFHVGQVRGIGGEVVLNTLLVTDVNHDVFEDAAGGAVAHGHAESTL